MASNAPRAGAAGLLGVIVLLASCGTGDGRQLRQPVFDLPAPPVVDSVLPPAPPTSDS